MTRVTIRLRAEPEGDAGFAMMFTLLLIFIVASLSIALAGIVYNQVKPTLQQRKTVATVDAASAGLQVALGQIRAANTGGSLAPQGVLTGLRCSGQTLPNAASFVTNGSSPVTTWGTTFTGTVNTTTGNSASAGNSSYDVSVAYYASDPTGQTLSWLQANAMSCPLASVPNYAFLQSHGIIANQTSFSGDRTQHATYQFTTTNTNVAGGRLISLGDTKGLCATDANITGAQTAPAQNDQITMQPCLAAGTPNQAWSYRNDLTLFLAGYPTANYCLQAASATAGAKVTLQPCLTDGTAKTVTYPYSTTVPQQLQEWAFNDNGHFATAANGGGVNTTCLDPAGQTDTLEAPQGAVLQVVSCAGAPTDSNAATTGFDAWNPDPQVGAGKAGGNTTGQPGTPTYQYVNYQEFGRCLDITGQAAATADHLIDYPCKQTPDSSQLQFNQVWHYTAVGSGQYGTLTVNDPYQLPDYRGPAGTYCLTAPAVGNILTVSTTGCSSPGANQLWQTTGQVVNDNNHSYELVNKSSGLCMAADNAYNGQIPDASPGSTTIVQEACDGSLKQKWNAPAATAAPALGNVGQDNGSANNSIP